MEKVDNPVNIRLLVGQFAIILIIISGVGLSYLNFSRNSYRYGISLLCWTIVFFALGIWSRHNPKLAFLTSLIFYLASVIIKDLLLGGEYLLSFVVHIYVILSIIIGMNSVQKNGR